MTQRRRAAPTRRGALIVFAIILTLELLALTILAYATTTKSAALTIVAAALLALMALLSIRLFLQTRRLWNRGATEAATIPVTPRTAVVVLLGLTLLAAALRLFQLGQESFWYDETWTATWAAQPVYDVVRTVNPLAYLIAHLTLTLSRTEFALRLAPALAGIALIPAVYLLGRTLYGRCEGLVAAALLTLSVYAIYHSQELRFYAWQMLFSTLTLYFLLRGLEHRRWPDWAGFAVTTMLNLYSHPTALLVLASEGLYTLVVLSLALVDKEQPANIQRQFSAFVRRLAPPALAALVALAALGRGWLGLASFQQSSRWAADYVLAPGMRLGDVWISSPIVTWAYELPSSLLALKNPALLCAMFVLFFIGLLSSSRQKAALALLWFLVPPLVLYIAKVRFYDRYLSYFLPLFTIVVAHGIGYLAAALRAKPQRRVGVIATFAVLVAIPSLVQLPAYYQGIEKDQWREVTAFVEANYQAGDLVLVTSAYDPTPLPFEWYATIPASTLPRRTFPEGPVPGVLTHVEQLDTLPAAKQGYGRVWFVLCDVAGENQALIAETMQREYRLVDEWHFVGLDLLLFEAHPPEPISRAIRGSRTG